MGLLTWAREALSHRSGLDENDRAALDQAFFQKAEAVGADPELLSAFAPSYETSEPELRCEPSINPPLAAGHDAQTVL